ncbi:hypothetical protein M501DRAFT_915793, partial [Patellaria atrata CBS 101060]
GVEGINLSDFDFSDTSTRKPEVLQVNIALITLVGLVVSLRIFVRSYFLRRIFIDDTTRHGLGMHVWLLHLPKLYDDIKSVIQLMFVAQVFYTCAVTATKISVILSSLRLIPDKTFRISMYACEVVTAGLWFTGVFVTIFQCKPVAAAWNFSIPGKCLNFTSYLYAFSGINIITDLAVCLLPLPHLLRLKLPTRQKIILCVLFGGGTAASVVCAIRIARIAEIQKKVDITYIVVPSLDLTVIECSIGIICVSIPPLRPLMNRMFPSALTS